MKFIGTIFVRRFDAGDGFFVEIVDSKCDGPNGETRFIAESWLFHNDYGEKIYMFGVPIQQIKQNGLTMESMVAAQLDTYKQIYTEEVIKEDATD